MGSMPGIQTSSNLNAIRAAAVRLNGWSGCRRLRLSDLNLSCEAVKTLLSELSIDQLSLSENEIELCIVEYLAKRSDIKCLRIGQGFSADNIRYLLSARPTLKMDLARTGLTQEERDSLKNEFGDRLTIY